MAERMDSDCHMEVDYVSSGESAAEAEVGTSVKKSNRHTPAQLATLNAYYKFGMVGVGKDYTPLITAASADCNLSESKVKVNSFF